ncbi:hypothetical protein CGCVW01_v005341 [Colletotrichum viniferum]|nr:hypothetical protein CGCVW01_v005341 [Colletotrichum viniferum]
MICDSQTQSAFVSRLPREVHDAVYFQLWRSCGLRQHILWHGAAEDKHFCRGSCTTEYQVEDELQRDIEKMREQLGVSLGQEIVRDWYDKAPRYCRRLQSPWMNHWLCGDRAVEKHGISAIRGSSTTTIVCWKTERKNTTNRPWATACIPMLLSCKAISNECLQSIYESTTFIFTDLATVQMFFGACAIHPAMKTAKTGVTPPAFFKYARSFELSLSPDFPALPICANYDLPGIPRRHDVYDFHWLRFCGIKEFDVQGLKDMLSSFKTIETVTLSTPLSQRIGPQEGYVDIGAAPGS